MRLFVAVYPSEAAVRDLDRVLAPLRDGWPELRWSPCEQWHLTLAFVADAPERQVGPLSERLARAAARSAPLALHLAGLGAFPSARRARVCWVGVAGDVEPLRKLARSVRGAVRHTGIAVDDKPYRPHLTVGRPRRPPYDVTALVEATAAHRGPGWGAGEIRLVHSRVGAEVRHETLDRWPLGRLA